MSSRKTLAEWLRARPSEPIQVTILFTDIVGSTKLCNEIGDRRWIDERLLQHLNQGDALIDKYGGYKIKFLGDSFMVAFRSAVSALKFATDFHKNTGHESINIRAGIHTGDARVIENDIVGRTINYAARILNWKRDDGVVLSRAAYESLIGEYGERRAKELFVKFTEEELKDYPKQSLYVLNFDEWWVSRIREAVPDICALQNSYCANGCPQRAATAEDVDWIAELEARTYDGDAVPGNILRAWYNVNPHGFSVLHREDGEMIGHVDILPLKPAGVDLLVAGQETERAITSGMIYTPHEQDRMDAFYVESIVIKDKYKELKPKALFSILNNFESLIARICASNNAKKFYGIGASESGERLMQQLGFRLIGRADERTDHHPLYAANYDDIKTNIAAILDKARSAVVNEEEA